MLGVTEVVCLLIKGTVADLFVNDSSAGLTDSWVNSCLPKARGRSLERTPCKGCLYHIPQHNPAGTQAP